MSLSPIIPPDIGELLRRAQLARSLQNQGQSPQGDTPAVPNAQPQAQPGPVQAPQAQAPVATPDMGPMNQAGAAYRQVVEQGAPNISDYHPSIGRRIAAVALGAIGGMHDPKTGFEVGQGIAYGPYEKQLSGYQQRLAEKKTAYEEEQKAAEGQGKITAEIERAGAERSRKGAEEERQKGLAYENSPEGRQAKIDLAKIEHPGPAAATNRPELVRLVMNDGKDSVLNATRDPATGVITAEDANGQKTVIKLPAIKEIHPLESKDVISKPSAGTPEEQEIAAYAKKLGKKPEDLTYEERNKAHADFAQAGETPALRTQRQMAPVREVDADYNRHAAILDKDFAAHDTAQQNWETLKSLLDPKNPQSDALVAPQLLKAVVGGMGSGLRMTMPEIMQTIGGRTQWEALQAAANKWSLDPEHAQIPDDQRKQIHALIDALDKKVQARQKAILDAYDELGNSKGAAEHRKVMLKYRQKVNDLDSGIVDGKAPGGQTSGNDPKDPLGILKKK
jgi:hypothetical protein